MKLKKQTRLTHNDKRAMKYDGARFKVTAKVTNDLGELDVVEMYFTDRPTDDQVRAQVEDGTLESWGMINLERLNGKGGK